MKKLLTILLAVCLSYDNSLYLRTAERHTEAAKHQELKLLSENLKMPLIIWRSS